MSEVNLNANKIFTSRTSKNYQTVFAVNGNLNLVGLDHALGYDGELLLDSSFLKAVDTGTTKEVLNLNTCGAAVTEEMYVCEMDNDGSNGYLDEEKRPIINQAICDHRLSVDKASAASWVNDFPGMGKIDHGFVNWAFEKNRDVKCAILIKDKRMAAASSYLNIDCFYLLSPDKERQLYSVGSKAFIETHRSYIGRIIKEYEHEKNRNIFKK